MSHSPDSWPFVHPMQSLLSYYRSLNTMMDYVFYDCGALTERERHQLTHSTTSEGAILEVYPRRADERIVRHGRKEILHRLRRGEGKSLPRSVVVAGVGSSDLGAAALARNVADHLDAPVMAVVSGYGMADLVTEGLGGWFVLGAANRARDAVARSLQPMQAAASLVEPLLEHSLEKFIVGSPDSTTLLEMMLAAPDHLTLMVGHSKGNFSIENALEGVARLHHAHKTPLPRLTIVTLGAMIHFPPDFPEAHQVMGAMDSFGWINSTKVPQLQPIPYWGATHSLNPAWFASMRVAKALELAGIPPAG
ncbi:MAG: hypothetical protein HQL51_16510 [Magnetococcales bacterium]|nr:hypothetical protein [Magnetococcales bacterium]